MTAMSSYLSSPNDSRNNRDSRYQETFSSFLFFSFLSTRKSKASTRPTHTHVTTYFFIGARTAAVIVSIAYSAATYMHSQFFPLAIGHGRGWLEKSRCVVWLDDTHWKRARTVTRSANDICRNIPCGANFIPRTTWPVLSRILLSPHIFRYKR